MSAPINDLDSYGQNPLHYAVCHGYAKDLVSILLDAECQVDVQRKGDLWTPLHLAVMLGKLEVVRLLVIKGDSDINKKDVLGKLPYDLAVKYRMGQIADFLERYIPNLFVCI